MSISNLVRRDPWRTFGNLAHLFDYEQSPAEANKTDSLSRNWTPAVDIKEDEKSFTLIADIPGVKPEDIEIQMENGVLSIKGERSTESKVEEEGYKRVERSCGSFERRFNLPDTADAENISANSKHGVLEVTIPKQKKVQARRITIDS